MSERSSIIRWKILAATLAALLVISAAAGLRGLRSPGASAQSAPSGNGDVNADQAIDISDPVYLLNHLFFAGPPPAPLDPPACSAGVVALVVRHAERETAGVDPCLTVEGAARAAHLRDVLSRMTRVDALLATNYCRTAQTLEPLATPPLAVQRLPSAEEIAAAVKALPPGSTAVVAGNSFNLSDIVKALGGTDPVTVPASEYDNLWVVHLFPNGSAPTTVTHLRY